MGFMKKKYGKLDEKPRDYIKAYEFQNKYLNYATYLLECNFKQIWKIP